jgi:hypothetical protein
VPALFAKVREVSNSAEKFIYIGFSQGTTTVFAGLADPVTTGMYHSYIKKVYALAPVIFLSQSTNPLMWIAKEIQKKVYEIFRS